MQILTIAGIIMNCYATYFTSKSYQDMFISQPFRPNTLVSMRAWKITKNWDELDFFYFVVGAEHFALLLMFILQRSLDRVPEAMQRSQREKDLLI